MALAVLTFALIMSVTALRKVSLEHEVLGCVPVIKLGLSWERSLRREEGTDSSRT